MCIKCGLQTSINTNKIQENRYKVELAQQLTYGIAQAASGALNLFGTGFEEDYTPINKTTETNPKKTEETPEEKAEKTVQLKKEVENILGKEQFTKLPNDIQEDVLNKYSAYKNVLNLKGEVLNDRIKTYVKALQAHKLELQMGAYNDQLFNETLIQIAKDPQNPTDDELQKTKEEVLKKKKECNIKIKDDNIEEQLETGTDEEYYGALKNRGQGYVDMYDTDNNQIITLEEFFALEEKDFGSSLTEEMKKEAEKLFKKIDKNNNGIDANEMASHLYAVSRMHDRGGGPNTVSDITFGEWHDSQHILTNEKVSTRYDNIYKQLYDVLTP